MAGEREIEEKKRNCKTDKVKYLLPVTVLLYFLFYKKYFGQGQYTNSEICVGQKFSHTALGLP